MIWAYIVAFWLAQGGLSVIYWVARNLEDPDRAIQGIIGWFILTGMILLPIAAAAAVVEAFK